MTTVIIGGGEKLRAAIIAMETKSLSKDDAWRAGADDLLAKMAGEIHTYCDDSRETK